MKVSTKLSGAFALQIAILVVLLVYHVRTIHRSVSTSYELSEISARLYISSTEQLGRIDALEENASKYSVTRDLGYLEKFHQVLDEFDAALQHLAALELSDREREEVARLADDWQEFRAVAEDLGPPASDRAGIRDLPAAVQDHLDRLYLQGKRVSDASRAVMLVRLEDSADAARAAERISWGAAAIALLLSALISGLIVRSISGALHRLQVGTKEVAEGHFAYRLDTGRDDEFAQVARDFNRMTQRLGELDRMQQDFISKISHDLKTPLASMQETSNILLDGVPGPLSEKQRRLLQLSHQSGERLSSMIGKLLDLSGLEAGAHSLDLRTHDLGGLVRGAIEQLEPTMHERGIRIHIDAPDPVILLECDAERIHQVLDNLLENALKFSPARGEIRVSIQFSTEPSDRLRCDHERAIPQAQTAAGAARISIRDAGPGVPDEQKDRIFERFFQTEAGRNVRGRGVGLGLTICREIVAAHGGALWVSDNVGGGSAFHVLLPGALRVPDRTVFATPAAGPDDRRPHET